MERVQAHVIRVLVDVLVILVLAVLVWVVLGVARDVWTTITTRSSDGFKSLSIELLTVFVFIELFHSLSEYMRYRRIRVTHLLDASLAFVLREVWVGMYGGHVDSIQLLALAALILALGGVRTLAVVFSPGERAAELAEASEVDVSDEGAEH
ncbi:MAG: phosphate-starvation-inducible PsiE family protein [Coriobacteriia bacterium]